VRHGQTAWNRDARFQGHSDVPLDETGRSQAQALAAHLSGANFARAIASDLSRARETAEIILDGGPLPLELDPQWREMRFGSWEGLTWTQIVERNPELAERPKNVPRFYTPQGGESFADVTARVGAAVALLAAGVPPAARVLVVTHAGPLHALLRVLLGEDEAAALSVRFLPATITRFALSGAGARVVELNRSLTESPVKGPAA